MLKEAGLTRRWAIRLGVLGVVNVVVIAVVAAAAVVFGWSTMARGLPDLRGWHVEYPRSEFDADDERAGYGLDAYLKQEERVFAELGAFESGEWAKEEVGPYCRFQASSICHPGTVDDRNWNRTFVFEGARVGQDERGPVAGVLMVHGLSDSPYSLRTLGQSLQQQGYTVVGLRVPGHGTCPGALAKVKWEDWTAAVRVAMRGLRDRVPAGTPLMMVGYSNGGALCVEYAARAVREKDLPMPLGIALYSPMIGITPMAEFTEIYPAVATVSGEPKLAWSGIEPEIDPYKYSSWPINASLQGYRLTQALERELAGLVEANKMGEFPKVFAAQSAADSTVLVTRLIEGLMDRTVKGRGELLLFDINRASRLEGLIDKTFEIALIERLRRIDLPFVLTVVTNRSAETLEMETRRHESGKRVVTPMEFSWPRDVFSLSHVALSIPPQDPVYGAGGEGKRLPLGTMSGRGERGVLAISEGLLIRMRYNPFHDWTQGQVEGWMRGVVEGRQ